MVDHHELYYLGGLFDGEGYCGVYKAPRSRKQWQLIAGIEMSRLEGLEIMRQCFGGTIHQSFHEGSRGSTYRLTYNAALAETMLGQLHPFTKVKYAQIALTLEATKELHRGAGRPVQEILEEYNEGLVTLRNGRDAIVKKGVSESLPLFVLAEGAN